MSSFAQTPPSSLPTSLSPPQARRARIAPAARWISLTLFIVILFSNVAAASPFIVQPPASANTEAIPAIPSPKVIEDALGGESGRIAFDRRMVQRVGRFIELTEPIDSDAGTLPAPSQAEVTELWRQLVGEDPHSLIPTAPRLAVPAWRLMEPLSRRLSLNFRREWIRRQEPAARLFFRQLLEREVAQTETAPLTVAPDWTTLLHRFPGTRTARQVEGMLARRCLDRGLPESARLFAPRLVDRETTVAPYQGGENAEPIQPQSVSASHRPPVNLGTVDRLTEFLEDRSEAESFVVTSTRPTIVPAFGNPGVIVRRSLQGWECLEQSSLKVRWMRPVPDRLQASIAEKGRSVGRNTPPIPQPGILGNRGRGALTGRWGSSGVVNHLVRGGLFSDATADEDRIYVLESDQPHDARPSRNLIRRPNATAPGVLRSNRLVALNLQSGRRLWSAGMNADTGILKDPKPGPTDQPNDASQPNALRGTWFLSTPVAGQGAVYVVVEEQEQIRLRCLDRQNGNLQWDVPLDFPADDIHSDNERRMHWSRPILRGGLVWCYTSTGKLVAVDTAFRSVVWMRDIADTESASETPRTRGREGTTTELDIDQRWAGCLLRFSGSTLVTMNSLSRWVRLIDARTGEESGRRLASTTPTPVWSDAERLILAGPATLRCLSTRDGEQLWSTALREQQIEIAGQGAASGNTLWLPTMRGVLLRVELDSGEIRLGSQRLLEQPRFGHLTAVVDGLLWNTPFECCLITNHASGKDRDPLLGAEEAVTTENYAVALGQLSKLTPAGNDSRLVSATEESRRTRLITTLRHIAEQTAVAPNDFPADTIQQLIDLLGRYPDNDDLAAARCVIRLRLQSLKSAADDHIGWIAETLRTLPEPVLNRNVVDFIGREETPPNVVSLSLRTHLHQHLYQRIADQSRQSTDGTLPHNSIAGLRSLSRRELILLANPVLRPEQVAAAHRDVESSGLRYSSTLLFDNRFDEMADALAGRPAALQASPFGEAITREVRRSAELIRDAKQSGSAPPTTVEFDAEIVPESLRLSRPDWGGNLLQEWTSWTGRSYAAIPVSQTNPSSFRDGQITLWDPDDPVTGAWAWDIVADDARLTARRIHEDGTTRLWTVPGLYGIVESGDGQCLLRRLGTLLTLESSGELFVISLSEGRVLWTTSVQPVVPGVGWRSQGLESTRMDVRTFLSRDLSRAGPQSCLIGVAGGRLFLRSGDSLECREALNGALLWRTQALSRQSAVWLEGSRLAEVQIDRRSQEVKTFVLRRLLDGQTVPEVAVAAGVRDDSPAEREKPPTDSQQKVGIYSDERVLLRVSNNNEASDQGPEANSDGRELVFEWFSQATGDLRHSFRLPDVVAVQQITGNLLACFRSDGVIVLLRPADGRYQLLPPPAGRTAAGEEAPQDDAPPGSSGLLNALGELLIGNNNRRPARPQTNPARCVLPDPVYWYILSVKPGRSATVDGAGFLAEDSLVSIQAVDRRTGQVVWTIQPESDQRLLRPGNRPITVLSRLEAGDRQAAVMGVRYRMTLDVRATATAEKLFEGQFQSRFNFPFFRIEYDQSRAVTVRIYGAHLRFEPRD